MLLTDYQALIMANLIFSKQLHSTIKQHYINLVPCFLNANPYCFSFHLKLLATTQAHKLSLRTFQLLSESLK